MLCHVQLYRLKKKFNADGTMIEEVQTDAETGKDKDKGFTEPIEEDFANSPHPKLAHLLSHVKSVSPTVPTQVLILSAIQTAWFARSAYNQA